MAWHGKASAKSGSDFELYMASKGKSLLRHSDEVWSVHQSQRLGCHVRSLISISHIKDTMTRITQDSLMRRGDIIDIRHASNIFPTDASLCVVLVVVRVISVSLRQRFHL